jgi:hypothetical protein
VEEGQAKDPPDDPSIGGGEKVLRRIVPDRYSRRNGLPEKGTFKKDGGGSGTSVTLWRSDQDLQVTLEGHDGFGVVAIYVDQLREHGLSVAFVHEPGNPNHCEIFGDRAGAILKDLAEKSRWVVHPADYPDEFKDALWTREDD